jgi:hypothetical protein
MPADFRNLDPLHETRHLRQDLFSYPSFHEHRYEILAFYLTRLVEDDEFASKFAKAIVDIYTNCVLKDSALPSITGSDMSTVEFLEKIYNDHLKIEKAFPEKQI